MSSFASLSFASLDLARAFASSAATRESRSFSSALTFSACSARSASSEALLAPLDVRDAPRRAGRRPSSAPPRSRREGAARPRGLALRWCRAAVELLLRAPCAARPTAASWSWRNCAACVAQRVALRLLACVARRVERRVALALRLEEVRPAALLGLVELPRLLGALVREDLIELGARRGELDLVGRALLGVLGAQLVQLPILRLALDRASSRAARGSRRSPSSRGPCPSTSASFFSRVSATSRSRPSSRSSRSAFVRSSASARSCDSTISLSFFESCSLRREDLLVLLVEPLAQIQELPARDAARLGAGREPRPSAPRSRASSRSASPASMRSFSISWRASSISRSFAVEALVGACELFARLVVLDGVDAREHGAGRMLCARGARRADGRGAAGGARGRCSQPALGRAARTIDPLRIERASVRAAGASGPVSRPNADSANASTSASTCSGFAREGDRHGAPRRRRPSRESSSSSSSSR